MNTLDAVIVRIKQLCEAQNLTPNALSYKAGVPQATLKSILNYESQNPGIVTIKKLCDGFDNPKITLADFFNVDLFCNLEPELD